MRTVKVTTKLTPLSFKKGGDLVIIDGVECFGVVCENELTRRFSGHLLIDSDLNYCFDLLDFIDLNNSVSKLNEMPFVTALTTIYGKIFAQADGRGVKLQKADVPEHLHDTHDILIQFRNGYAAHAGGTHEHAVTVMALNPNHNIKKALFLFPTCIVKHNNINPDVRMKMREILKALQGLIALRNMEPQKMASESIWATPLDELYKFFVNIPTEPNVDATLKQGQYTQEFRMTPGLAMEFRLIRKPDSEL